MPRHYYTFLFVLAILIANLLAMARNRRGGGKRLDRVVSEAPTWERISFPLFWAGMAYLVIIALAGTR